MSTPQKNSQFQFLFGTFISSWGSQSHFLCMMAFMKLSGFTYTQIGVVVGSSKLTQGLTNLFLGDLADRLPVRKLVLTSELVAAALSLALGWAWSLGPSAFPLFLGLFLFRLFVLAIRQPGNNKISKLLSEDNYDSNSRQAIWLNKVTQGTLLFASGFAFLAIKYLNYYYAIGFDFLTFLINGFLIWNLQLPQAKEAAAAEASASDRITIHHKFRDLYRYSARFAILDLLLAIGMCGANMYIVRFSGHDESWLPVYFAAYGLSVWVTGYLDRIEWVRKQHVLYWIGYGASYFLMALFPGQGWLTFMIFVLNYHCFWLLDHRYTSHIQHNTPAARMAGASSARTIQLMLVSVVGEYLVGSWQDLVPLFWEGGWRGIFCLTVATALALNLGGSRILREEKAIAGAVQ